MAKEPENDLAQLFAAALEDEETKHGRSSKAGTSKGPPTRGGVPRDPAGARGEATGDTSGGRTPARASVADAAQSRGQSPAVTKGATGTRVPVAPSTRPAPAPAVGPKNPTLTNAPTAVLPSSTAAARTIPPAPSTISGPLNTSRSSVATAPTATPPPGSPAPSARPAAPTSPGSTRTSGGAVPAGSGGAPPSVSSASVSASTAGSSRPMPTLNPAAARAPTTALPARAPGPAPDGLTAIPRSEAMTLDRVPQIKPSTSPSTIPPVAAARPGPRPSLSLPPPGPDARPSAAPSRKQTTAEIRGRPAAELSIDTAAEQLDHKGRSKPIFAPRTPRPTTRRIHPALDFAAGLFPGLRLMAKDRVASGLAYAIIGVVALLPAIMVLVGWADRSVAVERLLVHRAWIAGHFGIVVMSALVFEVVRCLSAIEPARRHVLLPRTIAALGLPAALVVVGAPFVMSDAPSMVEPLWFAAVPIALAGVIAGIDVVTRPEPSAHHRPALVAASAALASVLVVALVLVLSVETRDGLARRATDAGFAHLPGLIRALHVGS